MFWKNLFTSSLGRKLVMALTGIFLILFLLEHLIGNILLVTSFGENGLAFNEYAHFMKSNPLIKVGEIVLFGGILIHVIEGIVLIRKNRAARPQRSTQCDPALMMML